MSPSDRMQQRYKQDEEYLLTNLPGFQKNLVRSISNMPKNSSEMTNANSQNRSVN